MHPIHYIFVPQQERPQDSFSQDRPKTQNRATAKLEEMVKDQKNKKKVFSPRDSGINKITKPQAMHTRLEVNSPKQKERKEPTWERVQACFHLAIKDAAESLNIGVEKLRQICRCNGVKRWPYKYQTKKESTSSSSPIQPPLNQMVPAIRQEPPHSHQEDSIKIPDLYSKFMAFGAENQIPFLSLPSMICSQEQENDLTAKPNVALKLPSISRFLTFSEYKKQKEAKEQFE
jgi:hypothetical protein